MKKVIIAGLILFILPVFIANYGKYKEMSYNDMPYTEIGKSYTNYFTEGLNQISVFSEMGNVVIKISTGIAEVKDFVGDAWNSMIETIKGWFS